MSDADRGDARDRSSGASVEILAADAVGRGDPVPGICRGCARGTLRLVIDLGSQPPAESLVGPDDLDRPDPAIPLRILVCASCWLVQLDGPPIASDTEPGGLAFTVSTTMAAHVRALVEAAFAAGRPSPGARIVELASHGNRLADVIRDLGRSSVLIEPVPRYADAARGAGVPTTEARLDPATAAMLLRTGPPADLVIDAFSLAHEAEPRRFLAGLADLLAPDGLAVLEFDHILPVVQEAQYDGFRHGHASYLGLTALLPMLRDISLDAVEALVTPAYGGSLRVFVRRRRQATPGAGVATVLAAEAAAGLDRPETYVAFAERADRARRDLRAYLERCRSDGVRIGAYGAPSRGCTLLNSSGITTDLLPWTVDRSPSKQGRFLPGSRVPILAPDHVFEARPDRLLILTWDLADEIISTMSGIRAWGGRFVIPIPTVEVVP